MKRIFDRAEWPLDRLAMAVVAVFMLPVGLQAALAFRTCRLWAIRRLCGY